MVQRTENRSIWIEDSLARYEGPLLSYARGLTGDLEQARDLVQSTFLKLCRADPSAIEHRLAAWLYTVCRNEAMDLGRKEARMRALQEAGSSGAGRMAPEPEPEPETAAVTAGTVDDVMLAIGRLPAGQQEVLRLKFQAGLSYREIAEVTGHSIGNVGYLIHTAIRSVRALLEPEGGQAAAARRL